MDSSIHFLYLFSPVQVTWKSEAYPDAVKQQFAAPLQV